MEKEGDAALGGHWANPTVGGDFVEDEETTPVEDPEKSNVDQECGQAFAQAGDSGLTGFGRFHLHGKRVIDGVVSRGFGGFDIV